jgi:hypothetical protein
MSQTEASTEAPMTYEQQLWHRQDLESASNILVGYLSGTLQNKGVDLAELATEIENSGNGQDRLMLVAANMLRRLA